MRPRSPRHLLSALSLLSTLASLSTFAGDASAFGGSAPQFEKQGNFVVRNTAGFGFQPQATGFAFSQQVNSPGGTFFELRPALDYFVIPNLSVGGAIDFQASAPPRSPTNTQFILAPDVGYDLTLSDTFSFWPQASLNFRFQSNGDPRVSLVLLAAFLVHPAEHFFFGLGPGLEQELSANASTFITGDFLLGGYFDH